MYFPTVETLSYRVREQTPEVYQRIVNFCEKNKLAVILSISVLA